MDDSPPPTLADSYNNSKFWLEFALFDDGLESSRAAALVPPTLTAFHRFPDLPPELRLKIWAHLVQPRVVIACCFERSPATLPRRRRELVARSQGRCRLRRGESDEVQQHAVVASTSPASVLLASSSQRQAPPWTPSLLPPTPVSAPGVVAGPEGEAASSSASGGFHTPSSELHPSSSSSPLIPTLLHINHEARTLGLSHYVPAFGWRISALLSDTPVARPPRIYFNFGLDALYLTGELEAYDAHGFNSPMVYFLSREDTTRVRHVACPFRELHYPLQESEQIFGCLWHIVDRFPAAERLLLTVGGPAEEGRRDRGAAAQRERTAQEEAEDEETSGRGHILLSPNNVIQKIWNGWLCGTTVTSESLANKQMLIVGEEDLAEFIASR